MLAPSLADDTEASSDVARSADVWTGWLGPDRNGWVADFKSPDGVAGVHFEQSLVRESGDRLWLPSGY